MTTRELILRAFAWLAADHDGEDQVGHLGHRVGESDDRIAVDVATHGKGTSGIAWLCVVQMRGPLSYDQDVVIDPAVLATVEQTVEEVHAKVFEHWRTELHGHPAHSYRIQGVPIHPTSYLSCQAIGIGNLTGIVHAEHVETRRKGT